MLGNGFAPRRYFFFRGREVEFLFLGSFARFGVHADVGAEAFAGDIRGVGTLQAVFR